MVLKSHLFVCLHISGLTVYQTGTHTVYCTYCVVCRCVDHHWRYPCRCDEACRAGCEGLRSEQQLHAEPDCGNRSGNMGNNSQQGCFGAFRGRIQYIYTSSFLHSCDHIQYFFSLFLSTSFSGLFPSPLLDGHQGSGPTVLPWQQPHTFCAGGWWETWTIWGGDWITKPSGEMHLWKASWKERLKISDAAKHYRYHLISDPV